MTPSAVAPRMQVTRTLVCVLRCVACSGAAGQGLQEALTLAELIADADSGYVRAEVAREVRPRGTRGLLRARPASCRRDVAVRFAAVAQWCTASNQCVGQANGAAAPFDAAHYSFFGTDEAPDSALEGALEGGLEVL